jgi:hypothetical protein
MNEMRMLVIEDNRILRTDAFGRDSIISLKCYNGGDPDEKHRDVASLRSHFDHTGTTNKKAPKTMEAFLFVAGALSPELSLKYSAHFNDFL